ncbi:MAG: hypothetical protein ACYDAR_11875, partial [Thermomicrobiales bacterium]
MIDVRCRILSLPATRRAFIAVFGITLLTGCGGGNSPTATPTVPPATSTPAIRPTTTPPPTLDPIHIRTGSAIVRNPTAQTASGSNNLPSGILPPTLPLPTATAGTVLQPLPGGQTFTSADKKVSIRYPDGWDIQSTATAAQFTPKGASPTDPNVTRVVINGVPAQLDLLSDDNTARYIQNLAAQTTGRGATNLMVRSIDRVYLGSPGGPEAVRFVVSYTQGSVPLVSEQVIVQPTG